MHIKNDNVDEDMSSNTPSRKRINTAQISKDDFEDNGEDEFDPRDKFVMQYTLNKKASSEEMSKRKVAKISAKYLAMDAEIKAKQAEKKDNPFADFSFSFGAPTTSSSSETSLLLGKPTTSSSSLLENTQSKSKKPKSNTDTDTDIGRDTDSMDTTSHKNTTIPTISPSLFSTPIATTTPPSTENTSTISTSLFGSTTTPPVSTSLFTTPITSSSIPSLFGDSNSKAPVSTSLFGGGNNSSVSASLFGGNHSSVSASLFGNNSPNSTVLFTTPVTNNSIPSLFGGSSSTQISTSLFGDNNSKTPISTSLFGSTTPSITSNTTISSSLFGGGASIPISTTNTTASIKVGPNDAWKCLCCENNNPTNTPSCTICSANNPNSAPKPILMSGKVEIPSKLDTQTDIDVWKCLCCDTKNPNSSSLCSVCAANNPKSAPKTIQMSGKVETPNQLKINDSTTQSSVEDSWKCPCCDTKNTKGLPSCTVCSANNPNLAPPKITMSGKIDLPKSTVEIDHDNLSTPKPKPKPIMSTPKREPIPMAEGISAPETWVCKACDHKNFSTKNCTYCFVPQTPITPKPKKDPKSIWKCPGCDEDNSISSEKCHLCMVPKTIE